MRRAIAILTLTTAAFTVTTPALADQPGNDDATSIVIASGSDGHLIDSVTAGPLAAALSTSILLTPNTTLATETASYLTRVKPAAIYLIGGPAAITPATALQVAAADPGAHIYRLAGQTRYGTAAAIAAAVDTIND